MRYAFRRKNVVKKKLPRVDEHIKKADKVDRHLLVKPEQLDHVRLLWRPQKWTPWPKRRYRPTGRVHKKPRQRFQLIKQVYHRAFAVEAPRLVHVQ